MMSWISLAVLVSLGLLGAQAAKRLALGKVLWTAPLSRRSWWAISWLLLAGMAIATAAKRPAMHGTDALVVSCYLLSAASSFFNPSRVSVREGGICIGLVCLSWRKVVGWSWGPPPGGIGWMMSETGLCVWTTSRWRLIYQAWRLRGKMSHGAAPDSPSLQPQRAICTRLVRDGGLEALLRKYAPQAELDGRGVSASG